MTPQDALATAAPALAVAARAARWGWRLLTDWHENRELCRRAVAALEDGRGHYVVRVPGPR